MTAQPPPQEQRLGKAYTGPAITVFYDRARFRHHAEWVRGLPQVFDTTRRPWIRPELADLRRWRRWFAAARCGVDQHRPAGTRDQPQAAGERP